MAYIIDDIWNAIVQGMFLLEYPWIKLLNIFYDDLTNLFTIFGNLKDAAMGFINFGYLVVGVFSPYIPASILSLVFLIITVRVGIGLYRFFRNEIKTWIPTWGN